MSRRISEPSVYVTRQNHSEVEQSGLPPALFGLLALTVAIAALSSSSQLIWSDEFGILNTDSVHGVLHLIQVQRNFPICLDPMAYHLIAHASIVLFGSNAFAIRFPALIGYLTMQVCLFLFVRRCAGRPSALLAVALSTFSGPLLFASQGRPYGVLLGFSGLIAVAWQTAVRRSAHRALPLLLLALSLALTLNTHYYAVLLLVPLCAAEAVRTLQTRKLDPPLVLSILSGTAGLLFVLPFVRGAAAYNQHYHARTGFNLRFVSHAWVWLLAGDPPVSPVLLKAGEDLLALFLLTALVLNRKRLASLHLPASAPQLTLLAALPFFGLLLGTYVTHTVEIRFVLPAVFGLLALAAMVLAALLDSPVLQRALLAACVLLAVLFGGLRIRDISRQRNAEMATMKLPAVTLAALAARPGMPVFIQNFNIFETMRYYAPDRSVRDRLALFYSFPQDLAYIHSDTMALTARNLKATGGFNIEAYEDLQAQPGEHLFILYHSPIDWPEQVFLEAHAHIDYLGQAFGGDLVSVQFH